ncbi:uncharacterized protein LOC142646235 [Dermatophagoides pteronyssinus]|uniref:uncharacterized protein LOC142646235 n=1 Tax=Dermatophagoides pteronyssinus TaxID=6956 RepID=UPI003F6786D8
MFFIVVVVDIVCLYFFDLRKFICEKKTCQFFLFDLYIMMMAESRISLPKQQPKQQHFNYRKNCQLLIPSSSSSPSLNFKNYHSIDDDDDDDDENFKTKLKISTKNITKSSSLNDNILLTRIQMTNSLMNNDVDDDDEQQKQQQQQLSPEEYEQISKLLLLHFRDGRQNSATIDTIGQQSQYLEDDPHTWPSNWQSQAPKMILTPDLYLKEKPTLNEYQKNLIYRISNKYEPLKYYYLQMINQQQQQQKLKNHNNSVENDLPLNSFESFDEQQQQSFNKTFSQSKIKFFTKFNDSLNNKENNQANNLLINDNDHRFSNMNHIANVTDHHNHSISPSITLSSKKSSLSLTRTTTTNYDNDIINGNDQILSVNNIHYDNLINNDNQISIEQFQNHNNNNNSSVSTTASSKKSFKNDEKFINNQRSSSSSSSNQHMSASATTTTGLSTKLSISSIHFGKWSAKMKDYLRKN